MIQLNFWFYSIVLHVFLIFFFFALISRNYRQIFIFIKFWKVSIHFAENKVQRIYTINFYMFRIFDSYVSNVVNMNIFVWLFICFNIIRINIFYNDNIIKKIVCAVFLYLYLCLYYSFLIHIINTRFLLIRYLWRELVIKVFVLVDIL